MVKNFITTSLSERSLSELDWLLLIRMLRRRLWRAIGCKSGNRLPSAPSDVASSTRRRYRLVYTLHLYSTNQRMPSRSGSV
jgi:hypothetical protein